nr:hypothetical protein [Rhodoferax sp.]
MARVKLAFWLDADAWNGMRRVRFLVEAAELANEAIPVHIGIRSPPESPPCTP